MSAGGRARGWPRILGSQPSRPHLAAILEPLRQTDSETDGVTAAWRDSAGCCCYRRRRIAISLTSHLWSSQQSSPSSSSSPCISQERYRKNNEIVATDDGVSRSFISSSTALFLCGTSRGQRGRCFCSLLGREKGECCKGILVLISLAPWGR